MTLVNVQLDRAWRLLRTGMGIGFLVTGIDKFLDRLTDWSMYLSPLARRILPVGDAVAMRVVGAFEILLAVAILSRWARLGGYVAAAWLAAIAMNLVAGSFYDLALRDLEIALSAVVLGRLTAWHESRHRLREVARAPSALAHARAHAR